MTHPKARIEYPEDLKARVEDTRRKMRTVKDNGALTAVDANANRQSTEATHQSTLPTAFPDFECNLTILTRQLKGERGATNSGWSA